MSTAKRAVACVFVVVCIAFLSSAAATAAATQTAVAWKCSVEGREWQDRPLKEPLSVSVVGARKVRTDSAHTHERPRAPRTHHASYPNPWRLPLSCALASPSGNLFATPIATPIATHTGSWQDMCAPTKGLDCWGNDIKRVTGSSAASASGCCTACKSQHGCSAWTLDSTPSHAPMCFLKTRCGKQCYAAAWCSMRRATVVPATHAPTHPRRTMAHRVCVELTSCAGIHVVCVNNEAC